MFEAKTKKWIATFGIGTLTYYALSQTFTQFPKFEILTQTLYGPVTVLAVAAFAGIFSLYTWWTDY
jgi:hypothetical protein